MQHIESIDDALFASLPVDPQPGPIGPPVPPAAHPTYAYVADYGANGEFLGWGYVLVD